MPTEGQTATGPNGQKAVYHNGQWVVAPAQNTAPVTVSQGNPMAMPQAQASLTQTQTDTAATSQAMQIAAEKAERDRQEWQATHNPDGTPKVATGDDGLTAEARAAAKNQYGTLVNLASGVNDLRGQYDANFAGMNPLEGFGNASVLGVPIGKPFREQDRIFNDTSNSLTAFIATALGLSGQQFNTPAEQKLFIEGILPRAGDTDGQIEAKLNRLDVLIGNARDKGRATLGYTDANDPLLRNTAFGDFLTRTGHAPPPAPGGMPPAIPNGSGNPSAGPGGQPLGNFEDYLGNIGQNSLSTVPAAPQKAAGFGALEQSVPVDPNYQAEYEAFVRNGNWTPEQYADFRRGLDQKYNYATGADYLTEGQRISDTIKKGGALNLSVPPMNQELSGVAGFRNDLVNNPVGSFFASMGNAGGFGVPSLLAGDQMGALREANPTSSFLGEMAGGITGTMGAGAGLGALGGAVENQIARKILTNSMSADVLYGSTYGATQADDPVAGALLGGAFGAGGNLLGRGAAKVAPRLFRGAAPEDALSAGERRVFDAANNTGIDPVVAALTQADELGVPASIADVSPDVNSLTGAALRRSPAAAGDARTALATRGRGQYDRFLGAVERDLGPIENIPQRSEDLITQARAAAGPLYDKAYAAPGASVIDLSDLMSRPSMGKALANARRIAAEEGRDPDTLGIAISDTGEATLTPQASWQTLDYVKRGLDDVIEGYRDKTTGKLVLDTEGRAVNDTLRQFLTRVDEMNPDYAAARAAYAGPAAERGMLTRGQEALRMSPDQLGVNVNNASPSQVDQMRLGFQSGLAENAGRLRNNSNPFSTLDTPAMEARLGTMYDADPVARLLAQRDLEAQLASSANRLVGNSMTAERGVADQAFDQSSLMGNIVQGGVETALTGAPVMTVARSGLGKGVGQAFRDYRTLGLGSKATALADEIAPFALNTNSADAASKLLELAGKDAAFQQILAELAQDASRRGAHAGAGASSAVAAALLR